MITIGEKLNSSIPSTYEAMKAKNSEYISSVAKNQSTLADYIDINTAMFLEDEISMLEWCLNTIPKEIGICLDSPNINAVLAGLEISGNRKCFINSVSDTQTILQLKNKIFVKNTSVIVMPKEERIELLINSLKDIGILNENIYIDICIEAICTNNFAGMHALKRLNKYKQTYSVKTLCGLSNISFGLPKRSKINSAMLNIFLPNLDCAILDVLNEDIVSTLKAYALITGKDEYAMDYISWARG